MATLPVDPLEPRATLALTGMSGPCPLPVGPLLLTNMGWAKFPKMGRKAWACLPSCGAERAGYPTAAEHERHAGRSGSTQETQLCQTA